MADPSAVVSGNTACGICQINLAEVFCACIGVRVYLCKHCIADHATAKYRSLSHQFITVEAQVLTSPGYGERKQALEDGCVELRQNLARIDQCCEELAATFSILIDRLTQWRDYYIRELQVWKTTLSAEIEEAINEVESTLAQDEVQLTGKYSSLLRNYQPGTAQFFRYQFDIGGFETWVQNALKFEYSEVANPGAFARPEHSKILVLLRRSCLELFNFQSETFGSRIYLAHTIKFDDFSRYTLVDGNRVFFCGNVPALKSTAASIVYVSSGEVADLPPLAVARACPGLLAYQQSVFVFGRESERYAEEHGSGDEVEVLELGQSQWARLADMSVGRRKFTPCQYGANAYLCTAQDTTIDVFSLQTFSFAAPIRKPVERLGQVVTTVIDHELIILTEKRTITIDLRSLATREVQVKRVGTGSSCAPVVHQRRIYWVDHCHKCWRVSGNDFGVTELISNR